MKILYGIQGTGNGHLARARELVPELERHASVDILVSGTETELKLDRPVDYNFHGLSFVFGKRGGIDYPETLRRLKLARLARDITSLPARDYDAIVSDFEPISAWAGKLRGVPTFGLSHQAAFLSELTPRPERREAFAELVLRNFAPASSNTGFHFERYDTFIHTPIIREEVRKLNPVNEGHFSVYLPAYDDRVLIEIFRNIPDTRWQIFSKRAPIEFETEGIQVRKVSNRAFLESMERSAGVLCGAGFETPSEALYLGKKLLVVPMIGQYEQQCNAAALAKMGVPVLPDIGAHRTDAIADWARNASPIAVQFPDNAGAVVREILDRIENAVSTRSAETVSELPDTLG